MGFFDKLSGEFVDVIEYLDDTNNTLAHRFERYHNEIKNGAKLTVRESQLAIFVSEGQFADVFEPGMYELITKNLPLLTTLKSWKYGFNSPFKAEVYFINTRVFDNLKWGTPQPLPMRDPDFGIVQMRAHGGYHFKVNDPKKLITVAAGTDGHFTIEEIEKRLRDYIQTGFPDAIGESKLALLDMMMNYNEISEAVKKNLIPNFEKNGLELIDFTIGAITVPDAVQKAIDERSSMGALGNMSQYQQYKSAQAMEKAAENPNGGAGSGIGMGMGFGMASQMMNQQQAQQPQNTQQQSQNGPPPIPTAVQFFAVVNGQQAGPFGLNALKQMLAKNEFTTETLVWKEGMANWIKAEEVADLKAVFGSVPPPLPPQ